MAQHDKKYVPFCISETVIVILIVIMFVIKLSETMIVIFGACVCVCLCSSACWFLPAARHLWYTWEVRINDLLLWAFSGCFCQVPSSLSPNLSYFTSKDENSSRSITGEKTIWYNTLREKMTYIDIGNKSARTKPTNYEKILKVRRLL